MMSFFRESVFSGRVGRAVSIGTASALLGACGAQPGTGSADTTAAVVAESVPVAPIPDGPFGAAILRGKALLANTRDSLPDHVGNQLRCMSCHLDEGRRRQGSWVGVHARYPQYRPRSGTVETLEFRINDCLKRSMNGRPLPEDSREMREMIAYFAWLSIGVPVGDTLTRPVPLLAFLPGDSARGAALFSARCVVCHGPDGAGTAAGPPLWGEGSYNVGAGMTRVRTAATFIRYNMPLTEPGTLSEQEAFDLATFINRQPRPDYAGKELDWPNGDPPPDVAYETRAAKARQVAPR
jgi:thiosulfate dehydrogenase